MTPPNAWRSQNSMANSRHNILHVPPELAQRRLTEVLRGWQSDKSWSALERLISTRRVMIDGNLVTDATLRVKAGQVIKLLEQSLPRPATESDVRVHYLDADLVVVEKPAGMTSIRHPEERHWSARRRQFQTTLTESLPRLLARVERDRASRTRQRAVRAVHRLDRDTSGLMVFARTAAAENSLGRQFRDHSIQRTYQAIVHGQIKEQTIASVLVRDRGDGRRGSTVDDAARGKHAITHVRPLESWSDFTLVECRLETGRTHQIRIHLADQGHPVCGDKVYGRRGHASGGAKTSIGRLALHAGQLGFTHPRTSRRLVFDAPLPAEMVEFLDRLRHRAKDRGE